MLLPSPTGMPASCSARASTLRATLLRPAGSRTCRVLAGSARAPSAGLSWITATAALSGIYTPGCSRVTSS
ncbi:hypothetical protein G6F64_015515 [Rhizopus arrhizus]|uniref:Uncharacterized protein n=1 Tax=Rhizopus oryzae TaxID=64495 RepID=A0A9P7BI29_RHIOR|nr:hypothetical protein G6F64_015515 [Rhizopus arrhizus]